MLDVTVDAFDHPGPTFVATQRRSTGVGNLDRWVRHIWIVSFGEGVVCSVSPALASSLRERYTWSPWPALTSGGALSRGRAPILESITELGHVNWHQREILWYPSDVPPTAPSLERVEPLEEGDPGFEKYLFPDWDGGVFVMRTDNGRIVSYAGIKDKGRIQEIAVGTDSEYRERGYGKAVVAAATAAILDSDGIPTYVPDRLSNVASYALAEALGFEKIGAELFLEADHRGAVE